jgi:hypothetical protein
VALPRYPEGDEMTHPIPAAILNHPKRDDIIERAGMVLADRQSEEPPSAEEVREADRKAWRIVVKGTR